MKRVFNSIFAITSLMVLSSFSFDSNAGTYTIGTNPGCGEGSEPIVLTPATLSEVVGPDDSGITIPAMQFFTGWSTTSQGALIKGDNECWGRDWFPSGWYNPNDGFSTWVVEDAPATNMTINDRGLTFPIYPTEHEEFGIIVYVNDEGQGHIPAGALSSKPVRLWYGARGNNGSLRLGVQTQFRLVTLKEIKTGHYDFAARKLGDAFMTNSENNYTDEYRHMFSVPVSYNAFSVTLQGSTCSVTAGNGQTVTLPDVSMDNLPTVGSTAGTTGFNIKLACDEGIAVHATVTDANNASNRSDVLSLDNTSTAQGVGLQIIHNTANGTPLKFGPESDVKGNENQFKVAGDSSSPAVAYDVPFFVRYVRPSRLLVPGSVSAQAIITFSYQ